MYSRIALTMLVFLLFSCGGEHNHDVNSIEGHEHEVGHTGDHSEDQSANEAHDHEETKIKYTAYGNEYEVFAESDVFIVGDEAGILAHFSSLADFKPLMEGPVEMILSVDGEEVSQTLDKPIRPGIFLFSLKPVISGSGQIKFVIQESSGISQVTVNNVNVFSSYKQADKAGVEQEEGGANTITFTKEQSWKVDFATDYPQLEEFGQVIKTVARVETDQQKEVVLSARAAGIINLTTKNLLEGSSVKQGDLLLSIESKGLAENNMSVRLMEARNNYEKAKADYERKQELAQERIVSQGELLEARNSFENAKLRYENLTKNFNNEGQLIRSPMDGYIKQVFIKNGQFAGTGEPLLSIATNGSLILYAEIQQKYIQALENFKTVTLRKMNESKVYSLEELDGKLLSYGKFAGGESYLLPVNFKIENNAEFIPGSFVELYIQSTGQDEVITVPNSALLEEQGLYFVFVQVNPELFEKKQVFTGETDGIKTAVIRGLTPKERIVTRGAMLVKLAQSTGALDAHSGHVH